MTVHDLLQWMSGERTLYSPQGGEVLTVSAAQYLDAERLPAALVLTADITRAERVAELQRARKARAS